MNTKSPSTKSGNLNAISLQMTPPRAARKLTPQAFAERLISRESLERSDLNDPNCLTLTNVQTGEMLMVDSVQMERWLNTPD
ncbi:MAG: hypothetical protein R3C01_15675 [Planctomycetaceae bacterium]